MLGQVRDCHVRGTSACALEETMPPWDEMQVPRVTQQTGYPRHAALCT